MTDWISVNDRLPEDGQLCLVACWEFGCEPTPVIVRFYQLEKYFGWIMPEELYGLEKDTRLVNVVHYWIPIDMPEEAIK